MYYVPTRREACLVGMLMVPEYGTIAMATPRHSLYTDVHSYFLSSLRHALFFLPTNTASMHLVRGCPNARAGVKLVEKRTPYPNPEQPKFRPHIPYYH